MQYIICQKDIIYNIEAVKQELGQAKIIGVLKGNGYGFGRDYMARLLSENGIEMFAVTEIEDAEALRADILKDKDVLLLRSTAVPAEVARIADCGAIATIGSVEAAQCFRAYCQSKGIIGRAHIKIDSGMGRYGFLPTQTDEISTVLETCQCIRFEGIYTHFASAFSNNARTLEQLSVFQSVLEKLEQRGFHFEWKHAANSSAAFNVPASRLDAVRIGSAFTGRILGENAKKLKRVGYLEVPVVETKILPKGSPVGYNGTYTTKAETKVAILPVGHTDGWGMTPQLDVFSMGDAVVAGLRTVKKFLSKQFTSVQIGQKQYKVIGQIGLSHTAVDISGSEVVPGDVAKVDFSPLYVGAHVPKKVLK